MAQAAGLPKVAFPGHDFCVRLIGGTRPRKHRAAPAQVYRYPSTSLRSGPSRVRPPLFAARRLARQEPADRRSANRFAVETAPVRGHLSLAKIHMKGRAACVLSNSSSHRQSFWCLPDVWKMTPSVPSRVPRPAQRLASRPTVMSPRRLRSALPPARCATTWASATDANGPAAGIGPRAAVLADGGRCVPTFSGVARARFSENHLPGIRGGASSCGRPFRVAPCDPRHPEIRAEAPAIAPPEKAEPQPCRRNRRHLPNAVTAKREKRTV